jgi:integrase
MGLGATHTINLAEARERARQARQLLLAGVDPLESKRAEQATRALAAAQQITFKQAAEQYSDGHEAKWTSSKARKGFLSTLQSYAFPHIGNLLVGMIDTGAVLRCVEPIWKTKTATASHVRARIEAVLDWATVRGYRSGDNPARWKEHLAEVLPAPRKIAKTQHVAALPFPEMPAFMQTLRARKGVGARALEFTILTAVRTSETIGAAWEEIDLDNKVWTIPAARMKMKQEHRVVIRSSIGAATRQAVRRATVTCLSGPARGPASRPW